jgi:hypothetical protein
LIICVLVLPRMDAKTGSVFHYVGLNQWIRLNKICILLGILSLMILHSLIFRVRLFCRHKRGKKNC